MNLEIIVYETMWLLVFWQPLLSCDYCNDQTVTSIPCECSDLFGVVDLIDI